MPAGMETPELIELRKKKIEEAMGGSETPQLFTVLPEKRTATVGGAIMGSTHIYDMSTVSTWRILLWGAGQGAEAGAAEPLFGNDQALIFLLGYEPEGPGPRATRCGSGPGT